MELINMLRGVATAAPIIIAEGETGAVLGLLVCPVCQKVCKNKAGLTIHMRRIHGEAQHRDTQRDGQGNSATGKVPQSDSIEPTYKEQDIQVPDHAVTSATVNAPQRALNDPLCAEQILQPGLMCPMCQKVCKYNVALTIHLKRIHSETEHQDTQCAEQENKADQRNYADQRVRESVRIRETV